MTIADDDVKPVVSIAATDPDASEAGPDPGSFVITRTANLGSSLSVSFTRAGTAAAGSDYTAFATSVTLPAGQATATITVNPIDDALVEGPETVILTINPSANYDLGSQTSATVTITSDE